MKFSIYVSLALVCLVVCASAHPGRNDKNKNEAKNKHAGKIGKNGGNRKNERNEKGENDEDDDPKNCREPIEKSESCCNVPELLPESTFKGCADSMSEQFKGRNGKDGWKKNGGGKGEKKGEKQGEGKGEKHGHRECPCLVDCVFKNHSLYSADGSINVAAVTTLLTSNVSATWAPVVQTAITSCSAGVAGVNMSGIPPPPPGAPACNFTAALFMRCLKRQLTLSCPADSLNTTDTTCTAKLAAVQACDPFQPPKPHHKEGGLGSSEEQGGNMKAGKQSAKKGGNKSGKMASKKQSGNLQAGGTKDSSEETG